MEEIESAGEHVTAPPESNAQPLICEDERSRHNTRQLLDVIGDKWSLVVVGQLMSSPARFTALERAVEGISHRMLTQTLRRLERDGLVQRTVFPQIPPRVEYCLTPLGESFLGPIDTLIGWVAEHQDEIDGHRAAFDADRR